MAITTGMYQQKAPTPNLAEAYGRGKTMGQMIRKGEQQEKDLENKKKIRDIMSGALKSGKMETLYDPTTLGDIAEYSPETAVGLMRDKAKREALTEQKKQRMDDRKSLQKYRDKMLETRSQKLKTRSKSFENLLSPAEKKVDENFAKSYNDWKTQGGYAKFQRNITDASKVVNELLSGTDTTSGPLAGMFADTWAQNIVNPKAADVQDRINRIIMGSLRATLGAQFTEKEGQRVLNATYNPRQDEKVNARRIQGLLKELETTAKAKEQSSRYYEKFGTMKGYTGPRADFNNINSIADNGKGGKKSPSSSTAHKAGDIISYKGAKYRVGEDGDTLTPYTENNQIITDNMTR